MQLHDSDLQCLVAEESNRSIAAKAGKYLTFRLATEDYGLEILTVKEIIGLLIITKMPRTPAYIRGVINLRGKVIPVMDLRAKFGMEAHNDTTESCIIVVEIAHDGQSLFMGILVDSVSEVLNIVSTELEQTPELGYDVDMDFIQGMAKKNDKVIMLLDINKVVGIDELSLAKKISETA